METTQRVAIIGAGMTGLTAADYLSRRGCDVHVFDKGRVRGGRISTRRTVRGLFDHGAPSIEATGPEFEDFLSQLGATRGSDGKQYGNPGMQSIFASFDTGLPIRQEVRIASVRRASLGWVLKTEGARSFAHFSEVMVTIPAPQARELIIGCDEDLASELAQVRMHPVWTCLVEFAEEPDGFALPEGGPVLRADKMGEKPGRSDTRSAWVVHMTPAFTEENLNVDPAMMAPLILETLADTCGMKLPSVVYLNAHRWRYAFADQPLGRPYLTSREPGLVVGGDWTLGRRAEHGFESGRAMAKSVLSREVSSV